MVSKNAQFTPLRIMVPYIGWHPVNSKMSSKVPYEVTHSYQRNMRREYGIPTKRRKYVTRIRESWKF